MVVLPSPVMRKPAWLTKRLPDPQALARMRKLLDGHHLHTICEDANCPNLGECWAKATATFLILGNTCTRHCGFCNVTPGCPGQPDSEEPAHVADAVKTLGLAHVVITSVTRDDLADGGAAQFAATTKHIHSVCPHTTVEVLVPDFSGDSDAIGTVLASEPAIFAHNIETVESLHRRIRPRFSYQRSLQVLSTARKLQPVITTKSSIMVGLGETETEVIQSLSDLRTVGCDFVTVGQYLRPSTQHAQVVEYVHPDVFAHYRTVALQLGFSHVASGPFVRSSFNAAEALHMAAQGSVGGSGAEAAE